MPKTFTKTATSGAATKLLAGGGVPSTKSRYSAKDTPSQESLVQFAGQIAELADGIEAALGGNKSLRDKSRLLFWLQSDWRWQAIKDTAACLKENLRRVTVN